MNSCTFLGTITQQGLEQKSYNNGQKVLVKFTISVYGGKDKENKAINTYVNCTAFGKTAEILLKNYSSGSAIGVETSYTNNKITGNNGEVKYIHGFNVNKVISIPRSFNSDNTVSNNYNKNNSTSNGYNAPKNSFPNNNGQNQFKNNNFNFSGTPFDEEQPF